MRGIERDKEEEGLFPGILVEEFQGLSLKEVGAVSAFVFFGEFEIAIHAGNAVALVRVVIDTCIDDAVKVIKSPRCREKAFVYAKVPFAVDATGVGLGEELGDDLFTKVHPADALPGDRVGSRIIFVAVVRGFVTDHVIDSVALWITTGQESGSAGGAGRPGDVEISETRSFFRQPVKIRGDDPVPKVTKIIVTLVVRDYKKDVRLVSE